MFFTRLIAIVAATAAMSAQTAPARRLFPPEELGTLEGPDREEWQQPQRVMDALGIFDGATVADVGAGGGWFTIRLAHNVGPNGLVYAEDVQRQMIESIKRRVQQEGLNNVRTILGTPGDPKLPAGLQAVLIVDSYTQFPDPASVMKNVARALAPRGVLGVIDFKKTGAGGPGPPLDERLDPEVIVREAARAGLTLRSQETFLRYQYLLVFGK